MIEPRMLKLHLAEIGNEWATASLNCYSNRKKQYYHQCLGWLFAALMRQKPASMNESQRKELKETLDFFSDSLSYLKNSTINAVPYEVIHCLRCAMHDWIPNAEDYIVVTSYGDYSIRYKLALFDELYERMHTLYGVEFKYRLVQICLPKAHERNYLCNVALYHELGHFVERQSQLHQLIGHLLLRFKVNSEVQAYFSGIEHEQDFVNLQRKYLNYIMEYFADLFAAQYVGDSLMHYLRYIAGEMEDSQTHPSTVKRCQLVTAFLHPSGSPSAVLRIISSVTEQITHCRLERRNEPLPDREDFYRLLPCEVENEQQLHSLFAVGWDIWLNLGDEFERYNQIPKAIKLQPLQKFNILNNLIEKSINNFIVLKDWREAHERVSAR